EIEDPESHYLQALCRRNRALIRLARGDRGGALDDIDAGTRQSRAIRDPQELIPALSLRAFCLARIGDVSGAESALAELATARAETEQSGVYGPSVVVLAHALVE